LVQRLQPRLECPEAASTKEAVSAFGCWKLSGIERSVAHAHRNAPDRTARPQDGVISRLLANIYRNKLDRIWPARWSGMPTIFWAMCRPESQAKKSLRRIGLVMNRRGLKLHPEEDAECGLEMWEGKLCVSGPHDSKEAEHPAKPAHALHAAVAVA